MMSDATYDRAAKIRAAALMKERAVAERHREVESLMRDMILSRNQPLMGWLVHQGIPVRMGGYGSQPLRPLRDWQDEVDDVLAEYELEEVE